MSDVWIGIPGDGLMLRVEDRAADGSVTNLEALLQVPGLEARRLVYVHRVDDLIAYFAEMAKKWRGWQEDRCYESLEGDLRLSATHDGRHIRLDLRLAKASELDGWRVTAVLQLAAGEQLAALAEQARACLEPRA